jgi:hypothetical protein
MNDFDIVLINIIVFMTGFGSGLGFCFRYKNKLIARSRSQEFRNNSMNYEPQLTPSGPPLPPPTVPIVPIVPIVPSAPLAPLAGSAMGYPHEPPKREIVIRTTE